MLEKKVKIPHFNYLQYFTGKVIKGRKLTNSLSGYNYSWALVKKLGGEIYLVIDPELVIKLISKGNILVNSFWFNGKIQIHKKQQKIVFLKKDSGLTK